MKVIWKFLDLQCVVQEILNLEYFLELKVQLNYRISFWKEKN
jgi:hypothetical protein